ncbi:hypothetical protein [Marinobacterium lutimaris]|nr:hypothetical protein [Marinobacterium lutimaris]
MSKTDAKYEKYFNKRQKLKKFRNLRNSNQQEAKTGLAEEA